MQITTAALVFLVAVTGAVATPAHLEKRLDWYGVSTFIHFPPQSLALGITTNCPDHRHALGQTTSADTRLSQETQQLLIALLLPTKE
jgi:hypothetical protein